jgi:hypothetical protein
MPKTGAYAGNYPLKLKDVAAEARKVGIITEKEFKQLTQSGTVPKDAYAIADRALARAHPQSRPAYVVTVQDYVANELRAAITAELGK